jgi:cysteine-rich repeat protein
MNDLLRSSLALCTGLALGACSNSDSTVHLRFLVEGPVAKIHLYEEGNEANNQHVIELDPVAMPESCQERGDFFIRFDETRATRTLSLVVEAQDESGKVILSKALVLGLVSGGTTEEEIRLCQTAGDVDGGTVDAMTDAGTDALIDTGILLDGGDFAEDTGDGGGFAEDTGDDGGFVEDAGDGGVADTGRHMDAAVVVCPGTCCDGVLQPPEQCDDGNTANRDGCDDQCRVESGFRCGNGLRGPSHCVRRVPMVSTTTIVDASSTSSLLELVEDEGYTQIFLENGSYYQDQIDDFDNGAVEIIALGPGVVLGRNASAPDQVFHVGENEQLTLHGVTVIGKINVDQGALRVFDSDLFGYLAGQAPDTAKNEVIHLHGATAHLTVERCRISGAKKEGLKLDSAGGSFRVVNNMIYKNGAYAAKIGVAAMSDVFAHNTITIHPGAGARLAAVSCDNMGTQNLILRNNLFWSDGTVAHTIGCAHRGVAYGNPTRINMAMMGQTSTITGLAPFVDAPNGDLHLATGRGADLVANRLLTPNVTRDFDYETRTSMTHHGADEEQP